jgi:hypothetical protein
VGGRSQTRISPPHRAKTGRGGDPLQLRTVPCCSITVPTPLELARESTASKPARRPRTLTVEQFRLLVSHLRSQDARSDVRVLWPTHQRGTRVEVGGCRLVDCFTLRNSSQVPYLRKVVIPLAARTRILQSSRQHQFASRSQVGLEPHEPGTEPVARPQA